MRISNSIMKAKGLSLFDKESLPLTVGRLFSMNNYEVSYNVEMNGAQIDLVVRAIGDPFARPIYIEVTVEYVSTEKYGKDATKFLLVQRRDPSAICLSVSVQGFTASVKERAAESGVTALTYDELFNRFEKFAPYVKSALEDPVTVQLAEAYEEPYLSDSKGTDLATDWLDKWSVTTRDDDRWLIILGEYGTGKTALTRILQARWLKRYHDNPTEPIPIRIELRNFSRQFDASGLLHHFLDSNGLGHIPIAFMFYLIKTGRVVLILDGYDEMAQFLNVRERRSCLGALAQLSSEGARGILTSRPNYFTETEELNVFEALYTSLQQNKYYVSRIDKSFVAEERQVDELIDRYVLNRYERFLRDLTPEQAASLVRRHLADDEKGQEVILSILKNIFRDESGGHIQSLSGKPVIISYLLEVVEDINRSDDFGIVHLSEWEVYKLIVDRLMLRDLRRSPLEPIVRRAALQKLAVALSSRDRNVADESLFQGIIDEEFKAVLRRLPADERRTKRDELFEDLRSSATLTRSSTRTTDGWIFSHNSLREFLSTEFFLNKLSSRLPVSIGIPITGAMQGFAGSVGPTDANLLWQALCDLWPTRASLPDLGAYLLLLWEGARRRPDGLLGALLDLSGAQVGRHLQLSSITLKQVDLRKDLLGEQLTFNFSYSEISEVSFDGMSLIGSDFCNTILDSVSFRDCDLTKVNFRSCLLFECNFSNTSIEGANFKEIDRDSTVSVEIKDGILNVLGGDAAIGYLKYRGAITDHVESYYIYRNHPKYSIVEKVCERISEQKNNQLRGLTQRGEARADPPFAREFVGRLVSAGWIEIDRHDLVSATPTGRNILAQVVSHRRLPEEIAAFLDSWR